MPELPAPPTSSRALRVLGAALVSGLATSCAAEAEPDLGTAPVSGIDERALVIRDIPPPPLTGASITVVDESTVVVTDPDRDRVHVVGVLEDSSVHLPAGAQPWRAVVDSQGRVHVALRGLGAVASIDIQHAELLAIREVCPTVRGIGLQPDDGSLVVACAGGELFSLSVEPDVDEATLVARLDPDLRDVIVDVDGTIHVTRFRSAEVLTLDDDGTVVDRTAPPPWVHTAFSLDDATMRSSTAWRAVALPRGGWVMAHQGGSDKVLGAADLGQADGRPAANEYYGSIDGCSAVVQTAITVLGSDGVVRSSGALVGATLPVDLAVHPNGDRVVMATAATCGPNCSKPQLVEVALEATSIGVGLQRRPCTSGTPTTLAKSQAQFVAVAYSPAGRLWALQRDPLVIHLLDGNEHQRVVLDDEPVEDTAHRLFHETGTAGVACASCHAEGGDDGLVWNLPLPRHTPPLWVGLAGTEPLHWDGDLETFEDLVHEIHELRMGEKLQSDERIAAFESWVTRLRTAAPRTIDDDTKAGKVLFAELGCADCHGGERTTNNRTVAVGTHAAVQVPSLHGVALHPPYMHDARSPTLESAVREMVVQSRPLAVTSDAEIGMLVAYLETL